MSERFHIRPASLSEGDDTRILTYFDTQLPWLASIGSSGQWGDAPWSDNVEHQKTYLESVRRSEEQAGQLWTPQSVRVYFVEKTVDALEIRDDLRHLTRQSTDGMLYLPVAAMVLRGCYPDHAYAGGVLKEYDDNDPFIFVASLVSDRRTRPLHLSVGATLLDFAQRFAQRLGIMRICLDCWRGNGGKLVSYYERLGFRVIGEVGNLDVEQGEGNWPGAVLERRCAIASQALSRHHQTFSFSMLSNRASG